MKGFDYDNLILSEKIFGLEINDNIVKVLDIKKVRTKFIIEGFGIARINPQNVSNGVIVTPKEVAEAIKQARENARPNKIKRRFASVVLPDSKIFIRIVQFPSNMSKDEIQEAVEWKAKDLIPMPLEKVYWDWHRLTTATKEDKIDVVISAVEKECADSYTQTLKLLNITPIYYDISGNAAARFMFQSEYKNKRALLVRIDRNSVTLSLFLNGGVRYQTVIQDLIKGGYGVLIEYAASQLGLEKENAEKLVLSPDNQNPKLKVLLKNFFEAKFDHLKTEIKQILDFYDQTISPPQTGDEKGKRSNTLEGIILYGRGARIFYIDEYLAQNSIPVTTKLNIIPAIEPIVTSIKEENIHDNLVISGLAIRNHDLFKDLRDINLVPQDIKSRYLQSTIYNNLYTYLKMIFWNLFIIGVILIFSAFISINYKNSAKQELESVENLSKSAANQQLETDIQNINLTADRIVTLYSTQLNLDKFFQELSWIRNNNIRYTSLIFTEESSVWTAITGQSPSTTPDTKYLIISGVAGNRDDLQLFVSNIDSSKLFSDVKIPITDYEQSSNIEFTVFCLVNTSLLKSSN